MNLKRQFIRLALQLLF